MSIERPQGADIEITYEAAVTGLLATAEFRIEDGQGSVVLASQPFDAEIGATGVYTATVAGIGTVGQYVILATPDGSYDPETVVTDSLLIFDATAGPSVPPLIPISEDGAGQQGPCQAWTSADALSEAGCCEIDGSDVSVLDDAIVAASQLLYPLSNQKYPGTCEATVRPPCDPCNRVKTGVRWEYDHWESRHGVACGCRPSSRVALAGHARSILEVTIDGVVVDPDTYELRDHLWLVRMRDPADLDTRLYWPTCQDDDVALGEEGTFGITYEYGFDPPASGIMAAQELACAIYQSCTSDDAADCVLPQGITRIERHGITYDLEKFRGWGLTDGKWATGLPLVDAFLNAENPQGRRGGRAQVWSPDLWRFSRPVPVSGS